jgi:5'-phosphate synthase pdxT subunit
LKIGVLALQGAFQEHLEVLGRLGVARAEVRRPEHLTGCDGLILPGGETTTQRKLAKAYHLWEAIREAAGQGLPLMATCAGLILLSRKVELPEAYYRESGPAEEGEQSLNLLDVDVLRNAYGRQVFSFEALLEIPNLNGSPDGSGPFRAIFIRAPRIVRTGPDVSILARWEHGPVAVEQGNILGLTIHPE